MAETNYETMSVDDVMSGLDATPEGLSQAEVSKRQAKAGPNALAEQHESSLLKLLKFFWGPIPWMIEAAAILSLIAGDMRDFAIILTMLLFNALIGF